MTPIINAAGDLCGKIQVIWAGSTDKCHPTGDGARDDILEHTHTPSHWSTPTTVEQVFDSLYKNVVLPTMLANSLDVKSTHWLVLLDVYSSHRDAALLTLLRRKYPLLHLLYVPPNCTGQLQPLDVSFQGPFKKVRARILQKI